MPTGLFHTDPMRDQVIARQHVAAACYYWNEVLLKESPIVKAFGCQLSANNSRLFACVADGQRLFNAGIFPKSPGGFKRISAFVVLAQRCNFFEFRTPDGKKIGDDDPMLNCWVVRALSVMIPPILCQTVITIRQSDQEPVRSVVLNKWNGFPSRHFKAEFFHWLRGLVILRPSTVSDQALSSAILACSLTIEACYYMRGKPPAGEDVRGHDYDCLKDAKPHIEADLRFEAVEEPPRTGA